MKDYRDLTIVHIAPQLAGGVASVIEQLAREQIRLGANVIVMHPASTEVRFNSDGICVKECPPRSLPGGTMLLGVPYWKALPRTLEASSTIVHYHGLAGQGCLDRNRFPSVCTLHGVSALANLSPIRSRLIKAGFRRRTEFIAVDSATSEFFSDYCPSRIEVIPNGLPVLPDMLITHRDKTPTISFVGNLDKLKGYRYALDAARQLSAKGLDYKMLFAGPASAEELAYFESLCDQNALRDRIGYLGVVKCGGLNSNLPLSLA